MSQFRVSGTIDCIRGSVAWQVPLQHTAVSKSKLQSRSKPRNTHGAPQVDHSPVPPSVSSRELAQQKRIALLEEQLASMSAGNSKNSGDKSQLSGNSPNSLATAHARLDGIETTVLNIQALLQTMSTATSQKPQNNDTATAWPSMPRKQLFSDHDPGTQLALLSSAHSPAASRKASKRRKAITSPSDLNPQYNDQMDSGSSESF